MKDNLWLKTIVTLAAIILIAVHLIWPELKIDAITLGLLIVAVLPWLTTLIESAKLPGGWEVKFRDVKAAGQKIIDQATSAETKRLAPKPSYLEISDQDPNLALVGLRIEIEKRLRALAEKYQIKEQRSMMRMFNELHSRGILNDASLSGLQELVMSGNQAAHGAKVESGVADWAFNYGPQILSALDERLRES
jgi:hypothetical protein